MESEQFKSFKDRISIIVNIDDKNIGKLYEELLNIFSESEEDFIQKRHKELKTLGLKNQEIFPEIIKEMKNRLFKGRELSERQIKRIIYGE